MAEGAVSSKRAAAADGGDRLSALHDDLLHSIISFLSSRQAVQTTVLSRRWRNLWRSTPCLHIDHREFAAKSPAAADEQAACNKLLRFASSLLEAHRAPVLESFRLHVGAQLSPFSVNTWIRRGIVDSRAAALEIAMAPTGAYWFAPSLPRDAAAARRLTTMRLCRVRLDGAFADQLRGSSFPVLEDLALARCDCALQEMSSPTLRSLVIDCCQRFSSPIVSRSVTAPRLASLQLVFPKHATIQEAFSVNGGGAGSSRFRVSVAPSCGGDYFCFAYKDMPALLGSLRNVTTLELWRFSYRTVRIHSPN
ncbi:unnamed protein product [Urochloa decumbens]|uniref:F-box domain-containing protein n=1 Tax=Urochloa decumbens TaxID=240449 RepID=A0ABC9F3S1_9POAL